MFISFQKENIIAAAEEFLSLIGDRKCVALSGEMGAGKTTFVHAICDVLGVRSGVGSPTFSIINEYEAANHSRICHIDLYRLKNAEEAVQAGVEDCLFTDNFCFVEWPELAPALFPADAVYCKLKISGENERLLEINL